MTETTIISRSDPGSLEAAAQAILNGGIAVIPTETVYGMAVDPNNRTAMEKLYELKGRDADKPLARFINSPDALKGLDPVLPLQLAKCAEAFFPGPITIVAEEKNGDKTGFRMPDEQWTLDLVDSLGIAPGVTSTNLSGEPPLTAIEDIRKLFAGKVACIIDAGTISGTPSTVVEVGSRGIQILREGPLRIDEIRKKAETFILFVCSGNICRSPAAEYFMKEALENRFGEFLSDTGYRVESAGTYLFDGYTSPEEIIQVMGENGIDMSGHRSQPLSEKLLAKADRVYIMDKSHERYIRDIHPDFADKIRFLNPGGDIPDPYECSLSYIRESLASVKQFVLEASETL